MFELSQEENLLYSDDGSLMLTTQRVVYNNDSGKSQIMLEDYQGHEFKTAHIGNYTTLTIIFIAITAFITILRISNYFESKRLYDNLSVRFSEYIWSSWTIGPTLFFLGLSFLFYLGSRRYLIKLNGKYNSIEFRVRNPYAKSVRRFLERLELESVRVKAQHPEEKTPNII